jgi:hypothetical protein
MDAVSKTEVAVELRRIPPIPSGCGDAWPPQG